ncbi:EAL domain-containing protein [Salinarimonas soli]|uniref:EAL domain-containing protein n=1 Tax=Salinarimonas soli TaxID=1638099 RepID=A0A5B2VAT1_9HYPH|nr:EAL domain-containing protein [Salinarimonas soli]KAA2236633.1 EAL domain-containing protein [Salinarimonas soli]
MYPLPRNEDERLMALRALRILDTPPEEQFDAVCRTARRLFDLPIALVSLVDKDRQWFKARCGLDVDGTPRELAFCNYTILADDVFVVEDAALDERFRANALVTGRPHIRFYAGAPLVMAPGLRAGTLCVIGTEPRAFTAADREALTDLARVVVAHLQVHRARVASDDETARRRVNEALIASQKAELERCERELRERGSLLTTTLENMDQGLMMVDSEGVIQVHNRRACELLGLPPALLEGRPAFETVHRHQIASDEFARAEPFFNRPTVRPEELLCGGHYERERPDGTRLEVRSVMLEGGGVVRTYTDVTAARRNEAALRESERRYRTLAAALPHKIWVTDPDGNALFYNERMTAYHGPLGTGIAERAALIHPDDARRIKAVKRRAFTKGVPFDVEGRLRRIDGAWRWHKLVMIPMRREGSDEIVEWLGTSLDIEEIYSDRHRLQETSDLLLLAQEAAGAGVWDLDLKAGLARHCAKTCRMHGIEPPEGGWAVLDRDQWAALLHPDDVPAAVEQLRQAVAGGGLYKAEFRVRRPDTEGGGWRWIAGYARVVCDEAGEPARLVGLNFDITERRHAEEALRASEAQLRASEERLAMALDATNDGLWDWNVVTGDVWLSERWYAMLGYDPGEIRPHVDAWSALVHPDDIDAVMRPLTDHLKGLTPIYQCEHRVRHRDGSWRWILDRGKVVARDGAGRAIRAVGTHTDITDRKEAERRVEHAASHDSLTDLPNRALFRHRLNQQLAESRRTGASVALLYLDLDRFKTVNDTLGHLAGDALLRETARRMAGALRLEDTLARLGGDEFAVLQAGDASPARTRALAERLVEAVSEPFGVAGRSVSVGLSVGIALSPGDGTDADELFKNADLALYRAKMAGRNTYRFYEPAMDEAQQERQALELDLRQALARGEFALHYQPLLDLASGRISGCEALVRWHHRTRGMIPPGAFIALAEETRLIVPLGEWVLREACREAATWSEPMRISVNVSAVQFRQPGLVQGVMSALAASGLPPERLELEITETVLIHEGEALKTLHQLRGLGVRIALDDFGTGYSSLSYLRRFPFDKIKIDRSFVKEIDNPDTAAIVRAMVGLGSRLGIAITAEGVETQAQLDQVRAEGCTEAQGYLISRPGPAREVLGPLERMMRAG